LSKLAGDRLVADNPNITDLSDKNRPTKLGEMFNELYDNEWTNAFEGLAKAGYDDGEAIDTLFLTLKVNLKRNFKIYKTFPYVVKAVRP